MMMISTNQQLSLDLETANKAIDTFIRGYTSQMGYPLSVLDSVIDKIEKSKDPLQFKVHVETMQHMLEGMESTLKTLMSDMECLQNRR
jgi:hypothetical protein